MTVAFIEEGTRPGFRVHRLWGDAVERDIPMTAVERLLSRSSWLAEIVEGLVRAQDPVDLARAVVEEFMVARSQTPAIVSK